MIFQKFKKYWFQKQLQKELEIYVELPRNLTEDPIQKIAVLVDEVQLSTPSIQMDLEEKLHVSSRDIEVLVFVLLIKSGRIWKMRSPKKISAGREV